MEDKSITVEKMVEFIKTMSEATIIEMAYTSLDQTDANGSLNPFDFKMLNILRTELCTRLQTNDYLSLLERFINYKKKVIKRKKALV